MALTNNQLAATTHRWIRPRMVENIFNSNPLLKRLRASSARYDSGRTIVEPLAHADLDAVGSFSGAEVLDTTIGERFTAAEFNWRQYYAHFGITGEDEIQNSGREGILKLLKMKQKVAELSIANKLGTDLQAAQSGKSLDGLGSTLSASSTYGGIATADFANWIAQIHTLAVAGTLTLLEIQKLQGKCTIEGARPTVMACRQSVYDKIWSLLQGSIRYTGVDQKMADAGFGGITFNGVPIVVDSHVDGSDGGTSDNHLRCLNENFLGLVTHRMFDFKVVPIPTLKDQDVKLVRMLWAGNLTCSARRLQGEIQTIDPDN